MLKSAFLILLATTASAQSIPGAVLAKQEPHHHLAYEDSTLRVLRVRVPPHDSTLLHEHDPDYFWIALGASTVTNAKLGAPDATITSKDLSVHYTFGNFAHVARNSGDIPFDNITVELLEPQTNVRNLCEPAIADKPLECPRPSPTTLAFYDATDRPAVATAQLRVNLMTIDPGKTMRPALPTHSTWIIALDTADAGRALVLTGAAKWVGGTLRAPAGTSWSLENRGRVPVRLLAVTKP